MLRHARVCALVFVAFVFVISADLNRALAQTPTPTPVLAGQVIISELRYRGPNGIRDEYVEIYNNTDSPITVLASDDSGGWGLAASDGNVNGTFCRIPNGTVIPARGHFLCVNPDPDFSSGYSLDDYPSGNPTPLPTATPAPTPGTYATARGDANYVLFDDIPDGFGIGLFTSQSPANQNAATRLDAFGFTNSPALFREGAGFATVAASNNEHVYYRDLRTGLPRDTGDNAADFLLVGTTPSIQVTRLGAPGPENLASPIVNNATITPTLLDPAVSSSTYPNRERTFTSETNASLGTLLIRRTITNNTGAPISRLRFRVVNITTLGTPGAECGGTCADVRALTSADEPEVPTSQGTVFVRGLRLEENPPLQPLGGGYNASLSADFITLTSPLPHNESRNIVFKLGIISPGPFRFFLNIEAQDSPVPIILGPAASGVDVGTGGRPSKKKLVMDTVQSASGAAAPASPAAEPSATPGAVYAPFFIRLMPTRAAEDEKEKEEEDKEEEDKKQKSEEAPPSAEHAPQAPEASAPAAAADAADADAPQQSPAKTRRGSSKKPPAAAKARPRESQ